MQLIHHEEFELESGKLRAGTASSSRCNCWHCNAMG